MTPATGATTYAAKRRQALRTLLRAGVTTTVTLVVPGTRDVVAQTTSGSSTQSQPVVALVTPQTVSRDASIDERAQVRKNQRHLTIAALKPDGTPLDFDVSDEQTIALEGSTWILRGVSPLRPDGATTILYEAEAQR